MRQLNPVSPKFIGVQLIGSAIVWAIFVVILLVAAVCGLIFDITWLMVLGFALAAGCIILAVIEAFIVVRQVKALGYLEREHDLLVQRGIMFRSTTVVPYGRLQYVEVSAGPRCAWRDSRRSHSTPRQRRPTHPCRACRGRRQRRSGIPSRRAAAPVWRDCDRAAGARAVSSTAGPAASESPTTESATGAAEPASGCSAGRG